MNEPKTISDSKKEFHLAFPFVIAPIYRRVTDELLVELHLLKHQRDFKENNVFAVGLLRVFEDFMRGYRPKEHSPLLFDALCKCNGFDAKELRKKAANTLQGIKNYKVENIEEFFINNKENNLLNDYFNGFVESNQLYSRLNIIGLFTILTNSQNNKDFTSEDLNKMTQKIAKNLGYSASRVEKDIGIYNSNLEKIKQALELMTEAIEREKRKKLIPKD